MMPMLLEGEVSVMTTVIEGTKDVFSLVGTVLTQIVTNPVLLFCLAAGLVPIAIRIFKKLKRAAK